MIGKQFKNQSFRSTLEYVLGKEKATMIDSNMGGTTPVQLTREFGAARRFRPNLQRACAHVILSIPHRDVSHDKGEYHEHLEDEQYTEIAQHWLKSMKFLGEELNQSQYIVARHHDTTHEHIHIIASRIRMNGSVVADSWDYRRSEVILRQLEKDYGLEAVSCSNDRVAQRVQEVFGIETTVSDRHGQTQKQKHHSSNQPPITQLLADIIDAATKDQPTVTQLIQRLQQQGVVVHPQFNAEGLFKEAIAFEMNGVKIGGYKLGSAYSFPGLQKKRGISYNPERDLPAIHSCRSKKQVEMPETTVKTMMAALSPEDEIALVNTNTNETNQAIAKRPAGIARSAIASEKSSKNALDSEPRSAFSVDGNNQTSSRVGDVIPALSAHQQGTKPKNYANSISPIIHLFWQQAGQPETYSGKYYDLELERDILKLRRKSGEEIAELPLRDGAESKDKGLTSEDLIILERLKELLLNHNQQQEPENQEELA
ncbi:relaxase/mobilization nuclease domain-containing protein [Dolichospermum sp. LEGE 00246]|nr:relaxase/mobilization nuclease domain-containing protein [Dolichospermum sp. LEGE 00246]MBE9258344.1 relaxase/mobilization nuclease domain-containing protein [Dolichospermum sp. LEGE 00246]